MREFRGVLPSLLLVISSLGGFSSRSVAQTYTFSAQTVGSASEPSLTTISITRAGVLSAVQVGGQGNAGVDFAEANGGTCTPGMAYAVGQSCKVGVTFSPKYPGVRSGAVELTASDGTVLGTQFVSGDGMGSIGTFVPGIMTTVAGQFAWLYAGDGVLASDAPIYLPFGIALDAVGNLYIADYGNNRIRKVTAGTGMISTIAGNGTLGGTGDGGSALQATMAGPTSVALDGAGNVYFSDSGNDVVRKVDASTGIISTVAGMIGQQGYSGDGKAATGAMLNGPNGLALDLAGNLYIADSSNNAIRRVDGGSGIISTVAGSGASGFGGDGGPATKALLNAPWSVTTVPSGGFYIADQGNNRIRSVTASGTITTVVGTGVGDSGGDGGLAVQADLLSPANVAIDVAGNLYVADSGDNRVRKVSAVSGIITTVGGAGPSNIGDYGPATMGVFSGPYTLALDGLGNLYVGDVFHNRVRKVTSNIALLLYQPMRLGRISASQTQSFENDGNAVLNVSSVLATNQSVVDPATSTCAGGMVLSPVSSCAIGSAFAPTQLGNPVFGNITIASDAIDAPGTLILEGTVSTQDPSTVSLSASTNLAPEGTSITFIISVSSAGVVPTGIVTLLDGGNPIGTASLGLGGLVTIAISNLTGGQHVLTASYPGDTNNSPGESGPLVVVIQYVTAPTVTTVVASANPVVAGSPLTLTASVAAVSAGTGVGTISGPLTFSDGTTVLGAAAVANGTASLKLSTLSAGQHAIVATYGGSTSYGNSASAPLLLTVQPASSKTVLAAGANPAIGGAALVLSAVVTSIANPTGSVTFFDGGMTLGNATIGTGGVASFTTSTLAVGSHTLSAAYAGNLQNSGSSSGGIGQTVVLATTATTVQPSVNPSAQGGSVIFSATVTGNGGAAGGAVQFFDGTVSLGSGVLSRAGLATLTTATLAIGSHSITASYAGDGFDGPSVSAAVVQTVQSATTTVALTSSLNPSGFAASVTFSVRVLGTGAQPGGVATLQDGANTLGVQTLDATGLATFTSSGLAIGSHTLVALYGGDTYHSANSAKLTQNVLQVTTAVLVGSAGSSIAGTPVTWTAGVAGASGLPLTGSVQFREGGSAIASVTINATGNATFSSAGLRVGTHSVTAVYLGDSLNEPATSNAVPEVVRIASTSVALVSSANPAFAGTNLTLTATVAGNGGIPGGSVTFQDGGTVLGVAVLSANGVASLSTTALAPGLHSVSAVYGGDAEDATAVSGVLAQDIGQQTTVGVSSSANPSMFQNAVTISVAVTGGLPANPATGSVTLSDGGVVVGTAALTGSATASFTLTAPALGPHTLVVSYPGDSRYSPASSPAFVQSVILRPTSVDLKVSAGQITAGQPVTFFASVQGAGPNVPSGTVSFVNGAVVLGSARLDASGVAALTFDPPQGSDQVVAQYLGDSLFAASNSLPGAVLVGPPIAFDLVVTPNAVSMQSGAHTTLQVAIGVAAGFSDTVQMGCAGLPASATCTFSQDQVKVTSGAGQTMTVVVDTGNPLGAGATARLASGRGETALSCMLPGGVLLGLLLLRGRRRLSALAALMLCAMLGAGLSGCSNSLQVNATPAGNYSFQIVGTGANSGVSQTATVALTVTQ